MRTPLAALVLLALFASGCVPYTVGTTADTAPEGEVQTFSSVALVPAGLEYSDDEGEVRDNYATSYLLASTGVRFGVGPQTDIGVYLPGLSGVVVNAKHQFQRARPGAPLGWAAMGGAGVINGGLNAHLEATLIASGREDLTATPYGGLRLMQTFPLSTEAVSDLPTIGPFGGVRIGSTELGVSFEVGVFYDDSALGLRDTDIIVVPSLSLHGAGLLRGLMGW
jgi:hypothetical protein